MNLKQRPDDFRVEELTEAAPDSRGTFAFYRLNKTGWTTPDAIEAVCRRWRIDWRRVSYGGLKDRHAVTSQYFTIERGPPRNLTFERIAVAYLGPREAHYTAQQIRANRFTIALRDMTPSQVESGLAALREVVAVGLPNYFDDQRFGSVGEEGEFIGREMVFGRFERALWLALAAPYEFDRSDEKRSKVYLRDHWGDWAKCRAKLPRGPARGAMEYLVSNPGDCRGAVARLRPELQGLYLAAYQSYLWNRMLGSWLTQNLSSESLCTIALKQDRLPVPIRLPSEICARLEVLSLPLPSARLKPQSEAEWSGLVEEVLRQEGLTLSELRVKGMHKPFFSKGDRMACVRPVEMLSKVEPDEIHSGRRKMILGFELPKGSYATMLVKRITAVEPAL